MAEIVDQYGRPVHVERLREPQAAPTFHGVRNVYSITHPSIGLTPERLTAILRQSETGDPLLALELYEDMEEKDLHYLSVLSTRKQTVAQLELVVKPASSSREDTIDGEFVREVLLSDGGVNLQSTFADIGDAIGKSFSCTEIMWDTGSDGGGGLRWFPSRFAWRDPRWFMFDWISGEQILVRTWRTEQTIDMEKAWTEEGWRYEMSGMIERSPENARIGIQPATAPLIPYKFITHIAKAKSGLPIRGGLSRAISWIYLFKNYVLKDWVIYAERYGMPSRLGKYAPGASDDDKNTLMRACQQLGSDAAAIVPESMVIELMEAKRGGAARGVAVYQEAAHYFDEAISKAVLGQTLTTELTGRGGSRAAAQVHEQVRRDILQWDAVRMAESLSRDLVRPLIDLNRGPRRRYPTISLKIATGADKLWMDMVGNAIDHGLPVGESALRDQLGLPAPLPGEKLLTPKQQVYEKDPPGYPIPQGGDPSAPPSAQTLAAAMRAAQADGAEPPQPPADLDLRLVARVVIVEGGLVWVHDPVDEPYIMLPGGGANAGETFRAAAVREALEETGLEIRVTRWLADFVDDYCWRRYYLARRIGGEPTTRDADGDRPVKVYRLSVKEAAGVLTSPFDQAALAMLSPDDLQLEGTVLAALERAVALHAAARRNRRRPTAAIDGYAQRMARDWRPVLDPLIDPIRRHLANARTLDDARARLHTVVDDMDTSALETVLNRATFATRAAARARVRLPR